MERKDFRIINSVEELNNVKYVRTKALKVCFGKETLILEKMYLGTESDNFEYVVSELEEALRTFKSLDEAKSFVIDTLVKDETESVLEESEPEIILEEQEVLVYEDDDIEEVELTKEERKEAKKALRRFKREIRRAKIKRFFIILLNVIVALVILGIIIKLIINR
jgi:t-SNARE complex subunit (syntaxin)